MATGGNGIEAEQGADTPDTAWESGVGVDDEHHVPSKACIDQANVLVRSGHR